MPAPVAESCPPITIIDTVVGRRPGGHQADYLAALEDALGPMASESFAPFRNGANTALLTSRWRRLEYLLSRFRALAARSSADGRAVLILPNPDFVDFVAAFLAVRLRLRAPAAVFLFVLRRGASGIVGRSGWKSTALEKIVRSLARRGHLHPVSDSRSALSFWEGLTGTPGSLVTIPVRERPADIPPKAEGEAVRFGLVGLFRPEKGAAFYSRVIDAALDLPGPAQIDVQLPDTAADDSFPEAAALRLAHRNTDAVRFLNGHLDNDAFTRLVSGIDVLVLPYDIESYGTGTSGIMHEVLALGGCVVTTRFTWAADEFADDSRVLWLDSLAPGHLRVKLSEARQIAESARKAANRAHTPSPETFREGWLSAIDRATLS